MLSSGGIDQAIERLLRRDRQIVLVGLVLLVGLTWAYLYYQTLQMVAAPSGMDQVGTATRPILEMMELAPWSATDLFLMFLMWTIMMVAMMVPSATPLVLLYARVIRHNMKVAGPLVHTSAFFAGYLIVWTVFSASATALQWSLEQAVLLSPMMASTSPVFGGFLLLVAAVYQWTPYKDACLRRCRSPVWFLSTYWQEGANGALRMGLMHGAYCLGCCWALMLLLFVGGVMNLLCIATITIFVLVEKVLPRGREIGKGGAVLMGLAGIALMVG